MPIELRVQASGRESVGQCSRCSNRCSTKKKGPSSGPFCCVGRLGGLDLVKSMKSVNIHEAKTHLSRLVERVQAGEEILIAKARHPAAPLVPLQGPPKPGNI